MHVIILKCSFFVKHIISYNWHLAHAENTYTSYYMHIS